MGKLSKAYFIYLILFLGLISAFGPFVIDMYLPSLPEMTEVFHCDTSAIQLGLTFCMVGFAVGQMVFGPASDKYGRRPVLIFSLIVFSVASFICSLSSSLELFMTARFLQGIGGAGGVVLSRSIAADICSGRELAKLIAILAAINNIAPIAAPVVGGCITHAWGWRGIFVCLLLLGVFLMLMSFALKESLGEAKRLNGRLIDSLKGYKAVVQTNGYMRFCIMYALAMASLFAYISSTPFILQNLYGLSALDFSVVFAVNAVALAIGSGLSIKFRTMICATKVGSFIGAIVALLAVGFVLGDVCGFLVYEAFTFIMLFAVGLVLTGSTAEAMNRGRECAGAASAVVGCVGYIAGGLVSPLVGSESILVASFGLCFVFLVVGFLICQAVAEPSLVSTKN